MIQTLLPYSEDANQYDNKTKHKTLNLLLRLWKDFLQLVACIIFYRHVMFATLDFTSA